MSLFFGRRSLCGYVSLVSQLFLAALRSLSVKHKKLLTIGRLVLEIDDRSDRFLEFHRFGTEML